MSESLSKELQQLERSGRVTARGHRPVHAQFGFESIGFASIKSSPQPAASTQPDRDEPLARDLDSAFDRLKRTVEPS